MPDPTIREIKLAVASTLQDALCGTVNPVIEGLQVVGGMMNNPTPPSLDIINGDPFTTRLGYGIGNREFNLLIRARVSNADHDAATELLDLMCDPRADESVLAALEADDTLGGVVDNLSVGDVTGYVAFTAPGGDQQSLIGCQWPVRILP